MSSTIYEDIFIKSLHTFNTKILAFDNCFCLHDCCSKSCQQTNNEV